MARGLLSFTGGAKRILPIAVSLVILAVIYVRVDRGEMLGTIASADPVWMAWALAALVPLVVLSAIRFRRMLPQPASLTLAESLRLVLVAGALNMVLPSKMGDLTKSWFLRQRGHLDGSQAVAVVVFERICDGLAMLLWCAIGLVLLPKRSELHGILTALVVSGMAVGLLALVSRRFAGIVFSSIERLAPVSIRARLRGLRDGWDVMHRYFWSNRGRVLWLAAISILIWFVNLVQAWMFIPALGGEVPLLDSLALTSLSILVGLLPLTFAGVGTRDAAVIFFFRDYLPAPVGAAFGLLLTMRYLIIGLAGLPFIGELSRKRTAGAARDGAPRTPDSQR